MRTPCKPYVAPMKPFLVRHLYGGQVTVLARSNTEALMAGAELLDADLTQLRVHTLPQW